MVQPVYRPGWYTPGDKTTPVPRYPECLPTLNSEGIYPKYFRCSMAFGIYSEGMYMKVQVVYPLRYIQIGSL